MEVNVQICHYRRSQCAMKGESLEVNFQIYHYWRSKCAMKGVKMKVLSFWTLWKFFWKS